MDAAKGGCDNPRFESALISGVRSTMKPLARFAAAAVIAAVTTARAQTSISELIGKVRDGEGKPIVGAEVTVTNKTFPERVQKATSDKKGNLTVSGIIYQPTAQDWTVAISAPGFVPVSAHVVARDSTKVLYLEDSPKLSAKSPSFELKIKAFAEIRAEFTMRPGDAAEEAAPAPAVPLPPAATAGAGPAGGETDAYSQAVAKLRAGEPEAAVELLKQAVDEKPDDWERRDLYAKVLLKLDRQGEATIQANKAAVAAPDKAGPYITLADIYLARGLPEKAADAVAKAQQLEPENMKVVERAAMVAANAGRLDEAIALNEKVLAAKPGSSEVMLALADLYNRRKQPKKAEEMLDKVIALDPQSAHRTLYNLGVVIENRDEATDADHRKAAEAFRKAIDLKPGYALAHRDLGFVLLRMGSLPEARKELQKYVDLDPQARDAADIKATIKSLSSSK
jgi:tetratricopeptide (TPR) repeat protein